jgi:hypothetical protein
LPDFVQYWSSLIEIYQIFPAMRDIQGIYSCFWGSIIFHRTPTETPLENAVGATFHYSDKTILPLK